MKSARHQEVLAGKPQRTVVPEARQLRKEAGDWLKQRRADAGLSQVALAARLDLRCYTFISQVENGFSRVPTETMEEWATQLGLETAAFAKHLLLHSEPELHRLLFGKEK